MKPQQSQTLAIRSIILNLFFIMISMLLLSTDLKATDPILTDRQTISSPKPVNLQNPFAQCVKDAQLNQYFCFSGEGFMEWDIRRQLALGADIGLSGCELKEDKGDPTFQKSCQSDDLCHYMMNVSVRNCRLDMSQFENFFATTDIKEMYDYCKTKKCDIQWEDSKSHVVVNGTVHNYIFVGSFKAN